MQSTFPQITANFETTLSTLIPIGGTTGALTVNTDKDGNTLPDGYFEFSISVGAANLEHITATKTGKNLTNIKSVNLQTGFETVGCTERHEPGEKIKITDFVILKRIMDLFNGLTPLDNAVPIAFSGAVQHTANIEEIATIRDIQELTGVTFPSVVINYPGSTGSTPSTTLTIPVVVPGGLTNPALLISLSAQESQTIASITCNGVAVPIVAQRARATGDLRSVIAILATPASGNVVITMTGAVNMSAICSIIENYNGLQVADAGADGNGTVIATDVIATGPGIVFDALSFSAGVLTPVIPPQNLVNKIDTATTSRKVAQSMESCLTASTVQTDYTTSAVTNWCAVSVVLGTTSLGGFLRVDGTNQMQANLNFGTNKGVNLVNPTAPQDAATKAYVDSVAVAGAPNADFVTKGIVERATQAETDAGTEFGGTGAALFVNPKELNQFSDNFKSFSLIAGQDIDATATSKIVGIGDGTTTTVAQDFSVTGGGTFLPLGDPTGYPLVAFKVFESVSPAMNLVSYTINQIKVKIGKFGSPIDGVKVSLQLDNGLNEPDGVPIAFGTLLASSIPAGTPSIVTFTLNKTIRVDNKNTFIVLERTGTLSATDYYNVEQDGVVTHPTGDTYALSGGTWFQPNNENGICTILLSMEEGKLYIAQPSKKTVAGTVSTIKILSVDYIVTALNNLETTSTKALFSGVASGFTSLTQGVKYYAGRDGVISTTNTFPFVGRGQSTTEVVINQSIV